MAEVAVIGGGIAGLTAALDLARAGHAVIVLDASDRPGGKLRTAVLAGQPIDVGAESALAVRPELTDLAREVGLGERLVTPATTSASIWSRGSLHPLPKGTLLGIPSDPESVRGLLDDDEVARLTAERPSPPLHQDLTVGALVAERLGAAVVDRLLEPLLGGVYAGSANALSLRAAAPQLWAAVADGGSLLDAARAAAERSRAGAGSGAGAGRGAGAATGAGAYSGPQATRSAFVGIRGGFGTLPGALVAAIEASGGRVRSSVVVRGLDARPGGGWRLTTGPTTDVGTVDVDAVVLAVPPAAAARLLAGLAPAVAGLLGDIETASMAVLSYAFDTEALGELPGSGILVPPVEGRTTKASTFSSNKWGWLAEAAPGTTFVRASIGRAGETKALQRDDEDLLDLALREIGEMLGRPLPTPVDTHVQRWGGALPQYAVGHLDRVAAIRRDVGRCPGLAVAGAAFDGVGLPAVVASAHTAAIRLLHHLDEHDLDQHRPAPKEDARR